MTIEFINTPSIYTLKQLPRTSVRGFTDKKINQGFSPITSMDNFAPHCHEKSVLVGARNLFPRLESRGYGNPGIQNVRRVSTLLNATMDSTLHPPFPTDKPKLTRRANRAGRGSSRSVRRRWSPTRPPRSRRIPARPYASTTKRRTPACSAETRCSKSADSRG